MFPILNKKEIGKHGKNKHTNVRLTNDKLWTIDASPQNIEQIYSTIQTRTMELKKNLEEFDSSNYFDEENIFDSLNFYSTHIHNIKEFCGVGEIKSLRTIKEIIKVVRLNLKKKRKQESTDQLDSDVASLDDLQKSFVEVSSTFKLPEICSKPMNSLREEEINTNSVEKTVPIVPEVSPQPEIEDELPDEESFIEVKSKQTNNSKVVKEFPFNLQNNTDEFITPILQEALLKGNLHVQANNVDDLEVLEEFTGKLLQAIENNYVTFMNEIDAICNIFDKYLLSFLFSTVENFTSPKIKSDQYQIDKNFRFENNRIEILLNTPIRYDNKRLFYKDFIKSSLEDLRLLHKNFDNGTYTGIDLDDLTPESRKLCERFDTQTIPILLIMPEYSLVLNKCIKILFEWLQYDKDYISFIHGDLKILEKRKKNMQSVRHNQKQIYNQLNYRIKTANLTIEATYKEFKEIFHKTAKKLRWTVDLEEKNQVVAHFKRELLKKKGIANCRYIPMGCNEMLDAVTYDLEKLESDLTQYKTSIHKIKPKRVLYDEKLTEIENLEQALRDIDDQLIHFFEVKKVNPNELVILENCSLKLKEIYMYKSSFDTLRKIHYDLPLTSLKFGLSNEQYIELMKLDAEPGEINAKMPIITKHDQLNIAMHIISSLLDNDWIKFYYTLPFNPERGAENIKKDVDDANSRFNRGDVTKERSLFCLQKWKRIHLRARLDDLRSSLEMISRFDILSELNRQLSSFDSLVVRREVNVGTLNKQKRDVVLVTSQDLENEKKKREAEILHRKLTNFFERKRNGTLEPKTYKFHSSRVK